MGVGSNPTGSTRRAPFEGAARIAGHPAAKVLDAAALPQGAAYFYAKKRRITVRGETYIEFEEKFKPKRLPTIVILRLPYILLSVIGRVRNTASTQKR